MKGHRLINAYLVRLLGLAGLAIVSSCTEDKIISNSPALVNTINVTGQDFTDGETGTRAAYTVDGTGFHFSWTHGDTVGIYPLGGDQVAFPISSGEGSQTAQFDGGAWALRSTYSYAAYYPFSSDNYKNKETSIPVSYLGQIQNGNGSLDSLDRYDYQASVATKPDANGNVNIALKHLGCFVRFQLTMPVADTYSSIELKSTGTPFVTSGYVDLSSDSIHITPTTTSQTIKIDLNNTSTTAQDSVLIVYAMLAPVDLSNGEIQLTLNGTENKIYTKTFVGKNMVAGKAYSYNTAFDYQQILEREALIAIYNALDGDNWTNKENWCSDKPVSEWYGVSTNNGYVEHLNLMQSDRPMQGSIPGEIGLLSNLQSINIWLQDCNNGLPKEIGTLKKLASVNIVVYSTENSTTFPEGLYDCVGLKYLNMTGAGISGTLSSKIGQLKQLERLELGSNNITGPLPEEIGELENLEILNISGYGKIGEIPSTIGNLKNLKQIHLNDISGDIPKEIGDIPYLEEIDFYSEYPVNSIPDEIYNIKTLKFLQLSFTQCPYTIPEAIGNLTELERLCINYDLRGEIPSSIGNLTKLKYINLSNPYSMGKEALKGKVPESIQKMEYWPYFWADVINGHPYLDTSDLYIPAPFIQAKDLNGAEINTNELYKNNKLTIIYSWDEVCPAVELLHPILKNAYSKYTDDGLEIIGYNGGQNEDYIQTLVDRFSVPWRNFSAQQFPFANGQTMCPGYITGLAIAIDSSGMVVYNTQTGSYKGLEDYIETIFGNPDWYMSEDFSSDGITTTIQQSTTGNGIDLVIMGDGFSDRQIADGTYANVMQNAMNAFFAEEPYKSFKDYFNVYSVNVVSMTEGYEHSGQALGTGHGDATYVYGNDAKVIEYAKKAISEDKLDDAVIIVMMNEDAYAGTCYMYDPVDGDYGRGTAIAYFPTNSITENFNGLVLHEAGGHGFAKLADEYAYEYNGTITQEAIDANKVNEPYGWWKNVDFTSDPTKVKWSTFISDSRYANENIGCYEGGLTYWSGVWRPTEESIMRYNTGRFNAPSRYAIWYRINKLAFGDSWNGTYEDFVEYDAINRTPSAVSRRTQSRRNYVEKPLPQLAPPVVVGHSWREAK